jgi:hypothetical protein
MLYDPLICDISQDRSRRRFSPCLAGRLADEMPSQLLDRAVGSDDKQLKRRRNYRFSDIQQIG